MPRDDAHSRPEGRPTDRRLRPEHRLRRRKDFESVLSGGARLKAQFMTLVLRPNGVDHPRLGLSVPRRAVRGAVARHRVKRRIRESFRHHADHLSGLDVVVIARSGAESLSPKRFRAVLAKAWVRAGTVAGRTGNAARASEDA